MPIQYKKVVKESSRAASVRFRLNQGTLRDEPANGLSLYIGNEGLLSPNMPPIFSATPALPVETS